MMKQTWKNNKKYFLRKGEINNYNALIDGRNFYDQPINDLLKQYDEVRSDLRSIQPVVFQWIAAGGDNAKIRQYTILEFYKGRAKGM